MSKYIILVCGCLLAVAAAAFRHSDAEEFRDSEGNVRCRIGIVEDNVCGLELLDAKGRVVARLVSDGDGEARLLLGDGKSGVEIVGGQSFSSWIVKSGDKRVSLVVDEADGVALTVENEGDASRCHIASTAGSSQMEFYAGADAGFGVVVDQEGAQLEMRAGADSRVRLAASFGVGSVVQIGPPGKGVQLQHLQNGTSTVLVGELGQDPSIALQSRAGVGAGIEVFAKDGASKLELGVGVDGDVVDTWGAKK